jgi:hypothetical protein
LLEHLRDLEDVRGQQQQAERALAALAGKEQELVQARAAVGRQAAEQGQSEKKAAVTAEELRLRGQRLAADIKALEQMPSAKKTLRYRTPVSRPVHTEEVLFECRRGKVAFIDATAFLVEVRRGLEEKGKQLRYQWRVEDTAGPVGAFRMRYVIERERGMFDNLAGATPDAGGHYNYGLSEWVIEPIQAERGETAESALATGSEFRQVVDGLDPHQSVVTFWVYPDSFAAYRRLRDYLCERDLEVAGRPLPEGVAITCSRRGSVSRGQ